MGRFGNDYDRGFEGITIMGDYPQVNKNYTPNSNNGSGNSNSGFRQGLWQWFRKTYIGKVWVLSGLFTALKRNNITVYDMYQIGDNGVNIHIGEDFIQRVKQPKRRYGFSDDLKRIFGGLPEAEPEPEDNRAITLYRDGKDSSLLVDIDPIEKFVRDLLKLNNPNSDVETIGSGGKNTRWITIWNAA